ncbi:pancreatic lipase-related protein 2-like [Ornithodoros turicata]|uniref:pancreatic lipase-related protein 2-like n=1 Tax=Ornithodoros turicata TaxID=34597 RepID=UPI003138F1DE
MRSTTPIAVAFLAIILASLSRITGAYDAPPATDADIEITSIHLSNIAAAVSRARALRTRARSTPGGNALSFPGVEGVFDISGNLGIFIPQSPEVVGIEYILYQNGSDDPVARWKFGETPRPLEGYLKRDQKLYFVVHGFESKAHASWVLHIKNEILAVENASLIAVDWSHGASNKDYSAAAGNTRMVARITAMLVRDLWRREPSLALDDVHYIGHSLGAQAGGFFGGDIKHFTGGQQVGRITGLDPAGPLFESYGVYLNKEHAKFVDIIHTSAGKDVMKGNLGITIPSGHVDFFPSGGKIQPGCKGVNACSHSRACLYYANSVRTCRYEADKCYNWAAFKKNLCQPGKDKRHGTMGHWASPLFTGNRYLHISSKEPHCAGAGNNPVTSPIVLLVVLLYSASLVH